MWMSLTMGNLVFSPLGIIKQIFESLFVFKTVDIRWKYIPESKETIRDLKKLMRNK